MANRSRCSSWARSAVSRPTPGSKKFTPPLAPPFNRYIAASALTRSASKSRPCDGYRLTPIDADENISCPSMKNGSLSRADSRSMSAPSSSRPPIGRQQKHELVAADPRQQSGEANLTGDPARDLHEQRVADRRGRSNH